MLNQPATPFELKNPPAFDDIGEGLAYMDEAEAAEIKRMEEAARERMRLDQEDPTQQNYYRREDRKTVVRTEEEYVKCQLDGIPMTVIPYTAAVQCLKEQEARKRSEQKAKKAKKVARKSRKRNR
jgi:hypothetical protein